MAGILTDMESAETFKAYESYLLGQPAKAGTVLRQGAFFYIWKEKFETDGTVLQTSYGTVVTTLDSESKTLFACREFLGGRRLPLGVTAAMTKQGISLFPDKLWSPGEGFTEWKQEDDFTAYVLSAEEAGMLYGAGKKTVIADCEEGIFKRKEARKSGKSWLITKQAAALRYGRNSEEAPPMNPLLVVFTTLEAAELWNRDSGDVRSAASGAGHRAARMGDGDRRKSGRTWLVTRNAMERLYGPPVFEKMRKVMKTFL